MKTLEDFVNHLSRPTLDYIRTRNEWGRLLPFNLPNDRKTSDRWMDLKPICHESHRRANWSGAQCSHEFYLALGLPDPVFDQLLTALKTLSKFNQPSPL